jgi:hypothetical protein
VKEGDELPYIPESIGNVRASLLASKWRLEGTVDFQSQMREAPGAGSIDKDVHSDGFCGPRLERVLCADRSADTSGLTIKCDGRGSDHFSQALSVRDRIARDRS